MWIKCFVNLIYSYANRYAILTHMHLFYSVNLYSGFRNSWKNPCIFSRFFQVFISFVVIQFFSQFFYNWNLFPLPQQFMLFSRNSLRGALLWPGPWYGDLRTLAEHVSRHTCETHAAWFELTYDWNRQFHLKLDLLVHWIFSLSKIKTMKKFFVSKIQKHDINSQLIFGNILHWLVTTPWKDLEFGSVKPLDIWTLNKPE